VQTALKALLVSPEFLFRVERDPPMQRRGTIYRVDDVDARVTAIVLPLEQYSGR
jgi:hypothetical protein